MNAPEAPFEEPWQAQLFALTVALNEAGHFSWSEWAAIFGPLVKDTEAERYWDVWSDAIIAMLENKGFAKVSDVRILSERWQAAARATPHGQPIVLSSADEDQANRAR